MAEDITFDTFDNLTISKNDLRDQIIEDYLSGSYDGLTQVTDFSTGSEALHLADVIATFLLEHRQDIDSNYLMSMIHTCVGEFLDNEGDMRGVHRIGASPSTGEVTFTRLDPDDTSESITIDDNTQVATNDAISFVTDGTVTISPGATSVNVNVICELEGEYTNVDPNQITIVVGDIGNQVSVTNESKLTGGCDIEDDDTYRNRILESPYNVPTGTLAWYANVCEAIEVPDPSQNENMGDLTLIPLLHDVTVDKGEGGASDVIITYNTMPQFTDEKAEEELTIHFNMPEWDIAGVTVDFTPSTNQTILKTEGTISYLFAILPKSGYELNDLKSSIADKIIEFNDDAYIGIEFNPGNLCSSLEDVTGVASARLVEYDSSDDSYKEVAEQINIDTGKVFDIYQANTTDKASLMSRIQQLAFTIDLELCPGG